MKNKTSQLGLSYLSIFATVPALVLSNTHEAITADTKQTETVGPEDSALLKRRLKAGNPSELLKRQSKFRLPRQSSLSPAFATPDDCPGSPIAPGIYSVAAPHIESGDTTGANNTVNSVYFYGFGYTWVNSPASDHVYSFTLSDRGANPKIEVTTTSSTFSPLVYILAGGVPHGCQGTDGLADGILFSRPTNGKAVIDTSLMNNLPLDVPLYLFVDSEVAGATGPYTLKMQDVTMAPSVANAIDNPGFFVRQHYSDFLNRGADPDGLRFWVNEITSCGADQTCVEAKRINDSGAFFLSIEFQETGYLVYRTHKAAFGNLPNAPVPVALNEFQQAWYDMARNVIVNQPGWEQELEKNKLRFFDTLVATSRFTSAYGPSLTPSQFVDTLFSTAGVIPSGAERQAAINEFGNSALATDVSARARALRRVAETPTLARQEFNRAFVLMQYFGYLRRNPNDQPDGDFTGYNFWLDKLNKFNGDFKEAEMVKAFLSSAEYRKRFGD